MRGRPRWWQSLLLAGMVLMMSTVAGCGTSAKVKSVVLPTASAGDVTITVDRQHYRVSEPVGVTVTNATKTAYYAMDGRSACTFLQMQRLDTQTHTWISVFGCPTLSVNPPHPRLIPPSAALPYTVAPGDAPSNPNAWQVGVYRVALQYSAQVDGSGANQISYSAGFIVQG